MKVLKKVLLGVLSLACVFAMTAGLTGCADLLDKIAIINNKTDKPSVGLEYTLGRDSTYYSVTGIGTCTDTNIVIPSEYEGLPVTSIGDDAFDGCTSLTSVYYNGTEEDWETISISYNTELTNATRYYYSETQPTEEGNYWHYDENGEVVVW